MADLNILFSQNDGLEYCTESLEKKDMKKSNFEILAFTPPPSL